MDSIPEMMKKQQEKAQKDYSQAYRDEAGIPDPNPAASANGAKENENEFRNMF